VHGTLNENHREFTGIRVTLCSTGGQSGQARRQGWNSGCCLGGRIVASRKLPESATPAASAGTVPAVADTGEIRWGGDRQTGPVTPKKVHGTLNENHREFTGIRVTLCSTGDSPGRPGGMGGTAAAVWAAESLQTEKLPESARPAALPGPVPVVADTRGNTPIKVHAHKGAWHLKRKSSRIYGYPRHFMRHRGQSGRAQWHGWNIGCCLGGRIVANRKIARICKACGVAGDSPRGCRHRGGGYDGVVTGKRGRSLP